MNKIQYKLGKEKYDRLFEETDEDENRTFGPENHKKWVDLVGGYVLKENVKICATCNYYHRENGDETWCSFFGDMDEGWREISLVGYCPQWKSYE